MTTIVTKNGSGAPLASDLVQGELAVDLTNKRLYTEDTGGTVIEVGTNPSTLTVTGDLAVDTNTLFVDASANAVGIGTSSPATLLDVASSGEVIGTVRSTSTSGARQATLRLNVPSTGGDDPAGKLEFTYGTGYSVAGSIEMSHSANNMKFATGATERMRIDSSGNLLVGNTTGALGTAGVSLRGSWIRAVRDGDIALQLNRLTSDGTLADFRKDGTVVGSIGTSSGNIIIGTDDTGVMYWGGNAILPWNISTNVERDNAISMGRSSGRYDDIYATNGTIQTSDVNEKQDIEALSEAETRVAVAAKALLRKFRWKSAVEEKGDDARVHFGIIAQDLQAAFEAEGLDAGNYGMFIHSTWWEHEVEVPAVVAQDAVYETQTDEEGNEIQVLVSEAVEGAEAYTQTDTYNTAEEAPEGAVERSRMGVRYSELLAFIIAAI